jgi:hypothetical protein
MKRSQAQYLLNRTKGLKYESTRKFTLAPKDLEAAEVLRKASKGFAGREEDAGTDGASAKSEPTVSSQREEAEQLVSDVWLTRVLHRDWLLEEKGNKPQDQ